MSVNRLVIPGTHQTLSDGDLVVLARFQNIKWVLHYGNYQYNGQQYIGWYFCSVPSQTILPAVESDLRLLTIVSAEGIIGGCPPPPPRPPHHHHHPGGCHPNPPDEGCPDHPNPSDPPEPEKPPVPFEVPFTKELRDQLMSAFISVDTEEQMNALAATDLPNGKLVRVNNYHGPAAYYVWNGCTREFERADVATSKDLQESEARVTEQVKHTESTVTEVQKSVETVKEQVKQVLVWGKITE